MLLRRYCLLRCCHAFAGLGATLLLGAALLHCTLLLQGWQHPELSVNAFIPHTHTFAGTRRIQGAARPARWLLRSACPEGCHVDGCVGDGAGGMRCTRCSSNLLVDKVTGVCGEHVACPQVANQNALPTPAQQHSQQNVEHRQKEIPMHACAAC